MTTISTDIFDEFYCDIELIFQADIKLSTKKKKKKKKKKKSTLR
jgi:hypothetical protein